MMKQFIYSIFLFCSVTGHAYFPFIDAEGISGKYHNLKGVAFGEKVQYEVSRVNITHQDIDIDFNKVDKNLVLADDKTSVKLNLDFSFLNVFESLSFKNVGIKSDKKVFSLSTEDLILNIDPTSFELSDIHFITDISASTIAEEEMTILHGLILHSSLKAKTLDFGEISETKKIPLIVRFLDLFIEKGRFKGVAKVDSYINVWLKLFGEISTNKEETMLDIKLDSAHLGIIPIKGKILSSIRALNIKAITVKDDHIIVDLRSLTKPIR